jgi:membrane protease YdiL (CAAX protease family)
MRGWLGAGPVNRGEVERMESPVLTTSIALFLPAQQMLDAGLAEEPVFRGILWGLLRKRGVKEVWIWLLQGMLFWVAHLYYLGKLPLSFWVIVPPGGLLYGLLAWRSRSIATSMPGHGFYNGVGQIVAFYRF